MLAPEDRRDDVADTLDDLAAKMRDVVSVDTPSLDDPDAPALGQLDIQTDAQAVTVTAETRNTDPSHIHVSILNGRLFIGLGEGPSACTRDLALPAPVDEESAVATFRNGVLDVVLPLRRRG